MCLPSGDGRVDGCLMSGALIGAAPAGRGRHDEHPSRQRDRRGEQAMRIVIRAVYPCPMASARFVGEVHRNVGSERAPVPERAPEGAPRSGARERERVGWGPTRSENADTWHQQRDGRDGRIAPAGFRHRGGEVISTARLTRRCRAARAAIDEAWRLQATPRGFHSALFTYADAIRERAARLVGFPAHEIAVTTSTGSA